MSYWERQKAMKSLYETYTKPVRNKYGLTQMEYEIIMFLKENPEYNSAAAIIRVRQFTKSHVSSAIKTLIEKGYLSTGYGDHNNKTIQLSIRDEAKDLIADGTKAKENYTASLFAGFSKEEMATIEEYLERMCENSLRGLENHHA